MKQNLLDALHDFGDWIDERRYWIAAGLVIGIALACLVSIPQPPHLEVAVIGPITIANWDDVPGARAYQIQGRLNGEDPWQTVAVVWDGHQLSWPSIPGMAEYRIRAWHADGPGRWSAAELVFFLPQPMIPRPDRERQDA